MTRTIAVPSGGATLSFEINRDTEPGWDFVFVEARTAGGNDWTTLPDQNGHTARTPVRVRSSSSSTRSSALPDGSSQRRRPRDAGR